MLGRSPIQTAKRELAICTTKSEWFSNLSIFGKRHLEYLDTEFAAYYNTARPHMERYHLPPLGKEPGERATIKLDEFKVKSNVGGLVKLFERRAA